MPTSAPIKCSTAGCSGLATRADYCPKCKLSRAAKMAVLNEERNFGGLYASKQWRRARLQFLTEYPQCCKCGQKATIVDHIISHRGDMQLFWDRYNWQPCCSRCHNEKTARERNEYRKSYRLDDV